MGSFKEAVEKLGEQAADFASLEVFTYTGDVNAVLNEKGDGIAWEALFTQAKATQGTIKLVAATRVQFDGDTQNFQTSENLARLPELLQVHEQSVNNGRLARQSLVQFFSNNIMTLVGKAGTGTGGTSTGGTSTGGTSTGGTGT